MRWHLNHRIYGNQAWSVQIEAMKRSEGRPRYGFLMEMGLGKTALTLNEFIDSDQVDINVVLAPNSFRLDWSLAPEEWGVGFLKTATWPAPLPFKWECGLYSINYEAVRNQNGEAFKGLVKLMQSRRCLLTVDEAYAVKNPKSDTTRAVLELAKASTMVRVLNGTPRPETVLDYYGQLRLLGELNGVNPFAFKNRFAVMGGFMGKQIKGQKNEAELAVILDRCSFRALKKDWRKDLPPQITVPVHLEMTDKQRQHYTTMLQEFYALVNDDEVTADLVLTQMDKMRQISSCLLMNDGKTHWIEPFEKSPKWAALKELLAGGGGKAIVVYNYKATGQELITALADVGLNPARIQGGMTPEEVQQQKNWFNLDPTCRVIVGQQRAMARGHTLLGQKGKDRCSRIMFFENDFGSYWREQMKDRNHRGEQDEPCTIFDFITSPIEQAVVNSLVGKKADADLMDTIVHMVREKKC